MCQEIYIENVDASRHGNECWCPLSDCYTEEARQKALAELGELVYEHYLRKVKESPDSAEINVSVEFHRW